MNYRYNESCSCGSHLLFETPVEQGYHWGKMVAEWREQHKHNNSWAPISIGESPKVYSPDTGEEVRDDN